MNLKDWLSGPTAADAMAHGSGVLGAIAYVGYQGYALYHGGTWDARAFGEGFGLMSAGIGALLFGKGKGSTP